MIKQEEYSKYEMTRILGARALQIAMNAPLLIKSKEEDLEKINYNALKIAEIELNSKILPISIHKPFPSKKGELKIIRKESKTTDEEKEIAKGGEIMELAIPEDEIDESEEGSGDEE